MQTTKVGCIILVLLFICPAAAAASMKAKKDALDYQKCILDMRHVTEKSVIGIMKGPGKISLKSTKIADLAVARCSKEKSLAQNDLNAEGIDDEAHEKMLYEIEEASKGTLVAQMMAIAAQKSENQK